MPRQHIHGADLFGAVTLEILDTHGRGSENAGPIACPVELCHDEVIFLRQALLPVERCAAAIGEAEPPVTAGESLRDTIRVGKGQQEAEVIDTVTGWGIQLKLSPPLFRRPCDPFTPCPVDRRAREVFSFAV